MVNNSENKLHIGKIMRMSGVFTSLVLGLIFIVLAHWNKSPLVDIHFNLTPSQSDFNYHFYRLFCAAYLQNRALVNKRNNKITELRTPNNLTKGKSKLISIKQNQSTTGKLWKPQWPWLGTGISKEMVGWIRF
jgi:hypothetical protein